MVTKEKNAEIRREIVRKIGIERVLMKLGCEVVDKQGDMYELVMLDIGDKRKRPFLKMRNPSISVTHIEGVPPGTNTVKAALAWRNQTESSPEVLT
jgi:pimeloyl-CoA synthetase